MSLRWLLPALLACSVLRAQPPILFEEVAERAGLDFVLENSPTPQKRLIETMPGGLAAFDYDNDGRLDLFFANGAEIPSLEKTSSKYWNRLYRNEGGFRFRDVTESAGVTGSGYSMGAAAADYDNDGDVDLAVLGVRRQLLYRNDRQGGFEEVSDEAGIGQGAWSVAAAWLDYDRDGWLDLFVVQYVDWSTDDNRFCGDRARDIRVYCHPQHYDPLPNRLYRNRGDGTFDDVSIEAGIAAHAGKGMGVAVADYDGDGFPDIFVTNDTEPSFLFHNQGDGTFEETGLLSGPALPATGNPISAMGVEWRDYNNDSRPDLLVTALPQETFPLYRNEGDGLFTDVTYASKIAAASIPRAGWGVALADLDNDGWKDIFTANSHVNDRIADFKALEYRQPNSVFRNRGKGTFEDVSTRAGEDFQAAGAHRGAIVADLDQDGRLDAVVTVLGEWARLYRNITPEPGRWLNVKLVGSASNRDGIGATLQAGEVTNHMTSAAGYASSVHAGVWFGLGDEEQVDVKVLWPSGNTQDVTAVPTNQRIVIREEERSTR